MAAQLSTVNDRSKDKPATDMRRIKDRNSDSQEAGSEMWRLIVVLPLDIFSLPVIDIIDTTDGVANFQRWSLSESELCHRLTDGRTNIMGVYLRYYRPKTVGDRS